MISDCSASHSNCSRSNTGSLRPTSIQCKSHVFNQGTIIVWRRYCPISQVISAKPTIVLGMVVTGIFLCRVLSLGKVLRPGIDRESARTSVAQRLVTPTGSGLFIAAPATALPDSTTALYKLIEDGKTAVRVQVKLGREYVGFTEVQEGLSEGDEVIISDMSIYDAFDQVTVVN